MPFVLWQEAVSGAVFSADQLEALGQAARIIGPGSAICACLAAGDVLHHEWVEPDKQTAVTELD